MFMLVYLLGIAVIRKPEPMPTSLCYKEILYCMIFLVKLVDLS